MKRGKKCEVRIQFDLSRFDLKDLFTIEKLLSKNGVTFDSGAGCNLRNWELDFSLSGPMSVFFKR